MLSFRKRMAILIGLCAIASIAVALIPPIPQPKDYHEFADQRTIAGIPHFWNVVSNIPFLIVGVAGLGLLAIKKDSGGLPALRAAYWIFFIGLAAVCFGSGYYHLAPSNATLAWDRLPMSVAFMAFVAILIGEHIDVRYARWFLIPLLVIGIFSVWYWDHTERLGQGDLRLYGLVQFLSLAFAALTLLLFKSQLTRSYYIWLMFGGYAMAKLLEAADVPVFAALQGRMAGHALKHVVAAAGMFCFVIALRRRELARI